MIFNLGTTKKGDYSDTLFSIKGVFNEAIERAQVLNSEIETEIASNEAEIKALSERNTQISQISKETLGFIQNLKTLINS